MKNGLYWFILGAFEGTRLERNICHFALPWSIFVEGIFSIKQSSIFPVMCFWGLIGFASLRLLLGNMPSLKTFQALYPDPVLCQTSSADSPDCDLTAFFLKNSNSESPSQLNKMSYDFAVSYKM